MEKTDEHPGRLHQSCIDSFSLSGADTVSNAGEWAPSQWRMMTPKPLTALAQAEDSVHEPLADHIQSMGSR